MRASSAGEAWQGVCKQRRAQAAGSVRLTHLPPLARQRLRAERAARRGGHAGAPLRPRLAHAQVRAGQGSVAGVEPCWRSPAIARPTAPRPAAPRCTCIPSKRRTPTLQVPGQGGRHGGGVQALRPPAARPGAPGHPPVSPAAAAAAARQTGKRWQARRAVGCHPPACLPADPSLAAKVREYLQCRHSKGSSQADRGHRY